MKNDIRRRVIRSMADDIDQFVKLREIKLSRVCESPIELELGLALCCLYDLQASVSGPPWFSGGVLVISQDEFEHYEGAYHDLLIPQFEVAGYRVDFLLLHPLHGAHYWRAGIECDGHEYHDKTKEQAARDKSRDRAISAEGITMFRFTGSEIYRSPADCARQILDAAENASAIYNTRDMPPELR